MFFLSRLLVTEYLIFFKISYLPESPASFLTLSYNPLCFDWCFSLCLLCPLIQVCLENACSRLSSSFVSMKRRHDNSIFVRELVSAPLSPHYFYLIMAGQRRFLVYLCNPRNWYSTRYILNALKNCC